MKIGEFMWLKICIAYRVVSSFFSCHVSLYSVCFQLIYLVLYLVHDASVFKFANAIHIKVQAPREMGNSELPPPNLSW